MTVYIEKLLKKYDMNHKNIKKVNIPDFPEEALYDDSSPL